MEQSTIKADLGPSPMADQLRCQHFWTSYSGMMYADYWHRGYSTDKRRARQKIPIPLGAIVKVNPGFVRLLK